MDEIAPSHASWSFQVGEASLTYEGSFILSKSSFQVGGNSLTYDRRVKHGTGVMRWQDGREYQGEFENDKMHGDGSMTWPNGDKYVGQYCHDRKEGIGKMMFADGSRYEGNWYKGKRHGEMLYIKPNGEAFHMEFASDKVVSKESIPSFDGWTLRPGYDVFIKSEDECSETSCCICLGDLCDGDTCGKTPCNHVFHKGCIDAWLRQKNSCPLCVQKISLNQVWSV